MFLKNLSAPAAHFLFENDSFHSNEYWNCYPPTNEDIRIIIEYRSGGFLDQAQNFAVWVHQENCYSSHGFWHLYASRAYHHLTSCVSYVNLCWVYKVTFHHHPHLTNWKVWLSGICSRLHNI